MVLPATQIKELDGTLHDGGLSLRQWQDIHSVSIDINTAVSAPISLLNNGLRGLCVIVPNGWTDADLGFQIKHGNLWTALYDEFGERVIIDNINTAARRLYIAPPAVWALGCWPMFRLVSLDPATGADKVQVAGRLLTVGFMG